MPQEEINILVFQNEFYFLLLHSSRVSRSPKIASSKYEKLAPNWFHLILINLFYFNAIYNWTELRHHIFLCKYGIYRYPLYRNMYLRILSTILSWQVSKCFWLFRYFYIFVTIPKLCFENFVFINFVFIHKYK